MEITRSRVSSKKEEHSRRRKNILVACLDVEAVSQGREGGQWGQLPYRGTLTLTRCWTKRCLNSRSGRFFPDICKAQAACLHTAQIYCAAAVLCPGRVEQNGDWECPPRVSGAATRGLGSYCYYHTLLDLKTIQPPAWGQEDSI